MYQIQLKEEERVAAVVETIDNEVRVVPRGAFIKTPLGETHTNRSFEGTFTLNDKKYDLSFQILEKEIQ